MNETPFSDLPQPETTNPPSELAPASIQSKEVANHTVVPPILSSKPTIWGLLAEFRRRWRLAVGLGLLVGAIAAASAWYLTSATSYTVATTLHVRAIPGKVFFNTQKDEQLDYRTYQSVQMSAVKRRLVLNSALRDPKVAQLAIVREQEDPLEWLSKELQVDFSSGPETMRISMIGKDKDALIILLDAIREAYLREEANKEQTQRGAHFRQLEDLKLEFEKKLKDKRKVVDQLANDVGGKSNKVLAMRQELARAELNRMIMDLLDLQTQLRRATLEAELPVDDKAILETAIPQATIEEALRQDPIIVSFEKERLELEKELADQRDNGIHPEKDAAYQQQQADLQEVQKKIAARRQERTPVITAELLNQLKLKATHDQAVQEAKIAKLKQMIETLDKLIRQRMEQNQDFGKKSLDLETQKQEIELTEQLWKKISAEVEALRVEIRAPVRMTTEEPAFATKRESIALKASLGAGFGGFGLVLLAFGIILFAFRFNRSAAADEVS